jgi:hypothetical protein
MNLEPGEIGEPVLDNWFINHKNIPELPKLLHLDLENAPDGSLNECKKITFTFQNYKINDFYTIYFYVPFIQNKSLQINSQKSNVEETIEKIQKYNSTVKNFRVIVTDDKCEQTQCIDIAYNINAIANYLKNIDNICSSCDRYNRNWICCGRFAPYMYMYFYLLFENNFDTYKLKHGFTELKQYQIYNFATVFYKVITGYAFFDKKYRGIMYNLEKNHNIKIPSHNDDPEFWYIPKNHYNINTF